MAKFIDSSLFCSVMLASAYAVAATVVATVGSTSSHGHRIVSSCDMVLVVIIQGACNKLHIPAASMVQGVMAHIPVAISPSPL